MLHHLLHNDVGTEAAYLTHTVYTQTHGQASGGVMSCAGNREEQRADPTTLSSRLCQDSLPPARTNNARCKRSSLTSRTRLGQAFHRVSLESPSTYLEDLELELDGISPPSSSSSEDDDGLAIPSSRWQGAAGWEHGEPRVCGVRGVIVVRPRRSRVTIVGGRQDGLCNPSDVV